jgi:hypothetical protein
MFTIQSMSLYICILKLYHARPCAHARLCMLFLITNDVYSHTWDIALGKMELGLQLLQSDRDNTNNESSIFVFPSQPSSLPLLDICVYPQSLPNAVPEQWIYRTQQDLDCICGSNHMMGWHSQTSKGASGGAKLTPESDDKNYALTSGAGRGGLEELVHYRSQSWEVRETMSLGYPKLMVI